MGNRIMHNKRPLLFATLITIIMLFSTSSLLVLSQQSPSNLLWRYAGYNPILKIEVSYDGKHIFVLDSEGYVYFLDKKGQEVAIKKFSNIAFDNSFSPVFKLADKKVVLIIAESAEDGQVYYAYNGEGKRLWTILIPGKTLSYDLSHSGTYMLVAYSITTNYSASTRVIVDLYQEGSKKTTLSFNLESPVFLNGVKVSVTEKGYFIVYKPDTRTITMYDPEGRLVETFSVTEQGSLNYLKINDEGTIISYCAASGFSCTLTVIDLTNNNKWSSKVSTTNPRVVGFSSDLSLIVVKNNDLNVTLIDTIEKTMRNEIVRKTTAIAVDYEGKYTVLAGDRTIYIFQRDGQEVYEVTVYGTISSLALSGDGRIVVAGDDWGRVYAFSNPAEEKTKELTSIAVGGVILVIGVIAIIMSLRKKEKPMPEEEEIIYPPE